MTQERKKSYLLSPIKFTRSVDSILAIVGACQQQETSV